MKMLLHELHPAVVHAPLTLLPTATAADLIATLSGDKAWAKIKGYCLIGPWFKTTCEITSGKDGEMGAVRRIAGRVDEVLVASTAWSYSYAQPKSPIDYHGTVEIVPNGKTSTLKYTLVYDAAALPAGSDKATDVARRTAQFTTLLNTMKAAAEAK